MRHVTQCVVFAAALLAAPAAMAQTSVEAFYKGKQLILRTGSSPGDGYDLYGRLVARHIVKHIPGHPTIVVQNVPGGPGGLRVANQFGNEYGDFVTAEKLGVGPHMPVLQGAAYPVATPTGTDPNEGMKPASAQ